MTAKHYGEDTSAHVALAAGILLGRDPTLDSTKDEDWLEAAHLAGLTHIRTVDTPIIFAMQMFAFAVQDRLAGRMPTEELRLRRRRMYEHAGCRLLSERE